MDIIGLLWINGGSMSENKLSAILIVKALTGKLHDVKHAQSWTVLKSMMQYSMKFMTKRRNEKDTMHIPN